jgi:hypothetical protein
MAEIQIDDPLFDYKIYRFGRRRQIFRGPQPDLRGDYVCFLGGQHTFGRFAEQPYPTLVGEDLVVGSLNLGTDGAGPGFFLSDPEILRAVNGSQACVIQAMSASAISNRMYSVRPRRNARLSGVSDLLTGLFPDVDFDKFSFVHGMLRHLARTDEDRFRLVLNEMKNAWIGRMQTLLNSAETKTVLFWFSQRSPDDGEADAPTSPADKYPHYVDRAMIDAVKGAADFYIECTTSVGLPHDLRVDGRTVLFRPSGEPIDSNRELPSPEMHQQAADALLPVLERILDGAA